MRSATPGKALNGRRRAGTIAIAASIVAAVFYAGYAAVSPIAVPWAVRRALERWASAVPDRTARIGTVKFEPFAAVLEAADFVATEGDGRTRYAIERARIDFSPATAWSSRPVLDALTLVAPRIEFGAETAPLSVPFRRSLTAARSRQVTVERGTVSRAGDPLWSLDGITIHADSLDLPARAGRFEMRVADFLGSSLELAGALSSEGTDGRLVIHALDLDRLERDDAGAPSGVLDLAGDFAAGLSRGVPTVRLANAASQLRTTSAAQALDATISAALSFDGARLDVEAQAALGAGGNLAFEVATPSPQGSWTVRIRFVDLPAFVLDTYALQALGTELTSGRIGGVISLTIDDTLRGRAELSAAQLALREPRVSEPTELGLALLEDTNGVIACELEIGPVPARSQPLAVTLGDALRTKLDAVGAAPHAALAALAGVDAPSLRAVEFAPGEAAPTLGGTRDLSALAVALASRPKVGVTIAGGFDPQADRTALAARQIELHVLLATADPAKGVRPQPLDFESPRVHDVLDEFAGERLPAEQISAIASRFDVARGAAGDAAARAVYYRAIFDALVAQEPIADSALVRLGRFRAQAVGKALVEAGVRADRLTIGSGDERFTATEQVPVQIRLDALER